VGVSGGGQHPGAVVAGQAAADQVAEVQGGGAALEPDVVGGGAAVAQLQAAAATAGELGDDPFDVGSVLAVVVLELGVGGPLAAGLAEQPIVGVQGQRAAGLGGGAPLA